MLTPLETFDIIPRGHQYSLGCIHLFLSFILCGTSSLRCASHCIDIVSRSLFPSLAAPYWGSGRLWLLRLGYYKLTQAKTQAEDWVWILDHTVQQGKEKCFVILGIRLSDLPPKGQCVRHEDVEPIALYPVNKSNGDIVYEQLEETVAKTGIPREIVGDHGSDLKSGVERFCTVHPETCSIYDIKHKTASLLKAKLKNDENWNRFITLCAQTKSRVRQTSLAAMAPPAQGSKARYMNLGKLINWAQDALNFVSDFQRQSNNVVDTQDPGAVQEKLGWITEYRSQIEQWTDLLFVAKTTEQYLRSYGVERNTHKALKNILSLHEKGESAQQMGKELIGFTKDEGLKAYRKERLLGSSEVIESVFGKLKRLEREQSKSGFTSLLLAIPAMLSLTTSEIIQAALESIPTKTIQEWCTKYLGETLQSKRRKWRGCGTFRNKNGIN